MKTTARLTAVVLLASACVEPVRSPRDGGQTVPDCAAQPDAEACDSFSRTNVMFTWAQAVCGLLLDCCTKSDRTLVAEQLFGSDGYVLLLEREPDLLTDALACRRAVALSLFSRFSSEFQAFDEGRRGFDAENARACTSWFQQGASLCAPGLVLLDSAHEPVACQRLFPPKVAAGARCVTSGDCLRPGEAGVSTCQSNTVLRADGGVLAALDGTCRSLPALGEACPLPQSECGPANYCSPVQRCQRRPTLGEVCVGAPCEPSTYCDEAHLPAQCALKKGNYEPCSTSRECRAGASCDPTLSVCLDDLGPSPLDVEFTFCLGGSDNRVARRLPFVPQDGGL